jgi:hypothetical protein
MATFLFLKMTFCKSVASFLSVLARKEPKRNYCYDIYIIHSPSWNLNFPQKFQSSNPMIDLTFRSGLKVNPQCLERTSASMFANDTQVDTSSENINVIVENLNHDLGRVCPGTSVECPGVGKECLGEIALIITLVTNKITYFMKD